MTAEKIIANFIMNDLKAMLKKHKIRIEDCPLKPEALGFLGRAVAAGSLKKQSARKLLIKWFQENMVAFSSHPKMV